LQVSRFRKTITELHVGDQSSAESAFLLVGVCLSLAGLLVWACHDAERLSPASHIRDLLLRGRTRYRKP
jgi:hypothetical protein